MIYESFIDEVSTPVICLPSLFPPQYAFASAVKEQRKRTLPPWASPVLSGWLGTGHASFFISHTKKRRITEPGVQGGLQEGTWGQLSSQPSRPPEGILWDSRNAPSPPTMPWEPSTLADRVPWTTQTFYRPSSIWSRRSWLRQASFPSLWATTIFWKALHAQDGLCGVASNRTFWCIRGASHFTSLLGLP